MEEAHQVLPITVNAWNPRIFNFCLTAQRLLEAWQSRERQDLLDTWPVPQDEMLLQTPQEERL